jgi:hypothetical protein
VLSLSWCSFHLVLINPNDFSRQYKNKLIHISGVLCVLYCDGAYFFIVNACH